MLSTSVPVHALGDSYTGARYRNLALLLAALSAIGPFSIDAYLPSFPEIGAGLGATKMQVQQTLTAYLLPFGVMSLWHGALSDALGRRSVVIVSLLLFLLAALGCALVRSIEALWICRALQGMVAGASLVVVRAVIRDLFEGERAQRLIAHVTVMFAAAPAIAPVMGGWLHVWFGWRAVFVFMAVFAGGMAFWSFMALPETLPPEQRVRLNPRFLLGSYGQVFSSVAFMTLALANGLSFAGLFLYVTSAPVFLIRHLHLGETEFLWLFGPVTSGIIAGSWLSARMAGRLTAGHTLLRGYVLALMAVAANLTFHSLAEARVPWSVAPLFLFATGISASAPTLMLLGLDLFPDQRGLAASCQGFLQTTIGAIVAGVLAPNWNETPLRLAVGQGVLLIAGLAATLIYLLFERRRSIERQMSAC